MNRLAGVLFFLTLFLAGHAAAYQVTGYYYIGTVNGKQAIQMSLLFEGASVDGEYQYVTVGKYLELTGKYKTNGQVMLREHVLSADQTIDRETGTFSGALNNDRRRFVGTWRSADGKRSLPFGLLAVAEYRRVTKTIKLDQEEEDARREEEKSPDQIVEVIVPYFYQAAPVLSALNHQFWEYALQELNDAGKEEEGIPDLGATYRIRYLDRRVLSLSVVETLEGGIHNFYVQNGENYVISGALPVTVSWDNLLTSDRTAREALLRKITAGARKLATDDYAGVQHFDHTWKDIDFSLNAKRLTCFYPREIGTFGSYDVEIPYTDLAPYLSKHSLIRSYLPAGH